MVLPLGSKYPDGCQRVRLLTCILTWQGRQEVTHKTSSGPIQRGTGSGLGTGAGLQDACY